MGLLNWIRLRIESARVQSLQDLPTTSVLAEDVFTPTSSAKHGFVGRGDVQKDLESALRTPGTQMVVYGESGAGKSSLVEHMLATLSRDRVATHCTGTTTYLDILSSVFDELDVFTISDLSSETRLESGLSASAGLEVLGARASTSITAGGTQGHTSQPFVKAQLTPPKRSNRNWHKDTQPGLLKIFIR